MSLLDELKALEDQVTRRITELRPAIAEFDELRKVANRLGLSDRLGFSQGDGDAASGEAATSPEEGAADASTSRASTTAEDGGDAKAPGTWRRPRASDRAATKARVGSAGSSEPATRRRSSAKTGTGSTRAKTPSTTATATARRSNGAARQQQILDAVRANPGITVAELAQQLDVAATNLYRPVKRLQERGELTKTGTRLTVAEQEASAGA